MRNVRERTIQTTCDHAACTDYLITASMSASQEKRNAAHRRMLDDDGWSDVEGRDYCGDHSPF